MSAVEIELQDSEMKDMDAESTKKPTQSPKSVHGNPELFEQDTLQHVDAHGEHNAEYDHQV